MAQAVTVRGRQESSRNHERNRGCGAVGRGNHEGYHDRFPAGQTRLTGLLTFRRRTMAVLTGTKHGDAANELMVFYQEEAKKLV